MARASDSAGQVRKAGPEKPQPSSFFAPDGKLYIIRSRTGDILDSSGSVVAGASYNKESGTVKWPGYGTIDVTPEWGPVTEGGHYERDFQNTKEFFKVIQDGKTYYVNRETGRSFLVDPATGNGRFVGSWNADKRKLTLFELPDAYGGQPGSGTNPVPPVPPPDQTPVCPIGQHWDATFNKCVPDVDPCPPGFKYNPTTGACDVDPNQADPKAKADLLDSLKSFSDQFFPDPVLRQQVMDMMMSAIEAKKGFNQILAEVRDSEAYRSVYGVNYTRLENGLHWMPEGAILEYRGSARRIYAETFGDPSLQLTQAELDSLLAAGVGLPEWKERIQTWKRFEVYGPTVRGALEEELGMPVADDRAFAFMLGKGDPELENAYQRALLRGMPALAGLGVRPEEEATILQRHGIAPEQAFRGYKEVAAQIPLQERLAFIQEQLNKGIEAGNLPATGSDLFNDTPFGLLFRAIQLGDGNALRFLRSRMDQETAAWRQGGSVAQGGEYSLGLLRPDERATL